MPPKLTPPSVDSAYPRELCGQPGLLAQCRISSRTVPLLSSTSCGSHISVSPCREALGGGMVERLQEVRSSLYQTPRSLPYAATRTRSL